MTWGETPGPVFAQSGEPGPGECPQENKGDINTTHTALGRGLGGIVEVSRPQGQQSPHQTSLKGAPAMSTTTTPEFQLFTAETREAREEAYWELLDRFAWEQKVDQKYLNALREKDPEHKHNHLNLLYSINAVEAHDVFDVVYKAICKAYGTDNPKEVGVSQVEEAVTLYARSLIPKTTNFAEIEQKVISNIAALLEEKPQTAEEWEEAYDFDPIGFTEEADLSEEELWVQAGHMVKISIDNTILDDNRQWVEVPYWVVTITPITHAGQEIRYTEWVPVEAEFTPGQAGNEAKLAELVNQVLAL